MNNTKIIKIVVQHPVPSLNRLFGMNRFDRLKEKKLTQQKFLLALQASEAGSQTLITFVRNTSLIVSGMLGLSETTVQKIFSSKSSNTKFQKNNNEPK